MGTALPQYAAPILVKAAEDLAEPPVYAYNYGVADDYSGAAFSQSEQRDGYATSGSYTVNYADNGDGITQDVSYSGTPTYGPAPVAVAHAAPILSHAVHAAPLISHAAPVLSHALHAAPVFSHALHAAPVLAHRGVAVAHAAPVFSHAVAHPTIIG